jgi:hypothetical protein
VTTSTGFAATGNMGCRTWWGGGDFEDRDIDGYDGGWLMGVNGPPRGRFDRSFEERCSTEGLLWVRTVDLVWAFQYHRAGFPHIIDPIAISRAWRQAKLARRRHAWALSQAPSRSDWIELPARVPIGMPKLSRAKQASLDSWHPDPGSFKSFERPRRSYFAEERERYDRVKRFWHLCGVDAQQAFRRCAAYSNRRPEAHPDYFVVAPRSRRRKSFAFVEVKGNRESVKPSQRRFFPELVRRAGQRVWLARVAEKGDRLVLAEINSDGGHEPRADFFDGA